MDRGEAQDLIVVEEDAPKPRKKAKDETDKPLYSIKFKIRARSHCVVIQVDALEILFDRVQLFMDYLELSNIQWHTS